MTPMSKPCRRKTVNSYRITIQGAIIAASGRPLVAELVGDGHGDYIRLREHGRRTWYQLSLAELYRKAVIVGSKQRKKG